jgi:hypothetical protein
MLRHALRALHELGERSPGSNQRLLRMTVHTVGRSPTLFCSVVCGLAVAAAPCAAEETATELAQRLSNPVAALISVPMQLNYDQDIGAARGGDRWVLNVQPVVPITLNQDWNLISRTIVPLVSQNEVFAGAGRQSGLGDVVQSFFFSPKAPGASGWIWGAGPVLLLPTGSDDLLSARKWGAGPTAVVLKQQNGWTYGALANHIWSFAGDSGRADVNSTFIQPFLSFTTPDAWSFTLNTESTYNWDSKQWTVPINATVSRVTRIGGQMVSIGGGLRYWAEGPDGAPHGLGLRFTITLLFPR